MPRLVTSAMATRKMLDSILQQIKSTGFVNIEENREAGSVRVVDDNGEIPIQALAKGPHGPYIVMYYNTKRYTWDMGKENTNARNNNAKAPDTPAPVE